MTHFATKSLATVSLATALLASVAAAPARAAGADASVWTPTVYSLGGPSVIPVVISTRVDTGDDEEDVLVSAKRAPIAPLNDPDFSSPQSVFNVGGDPLVRPANCSEEYTTVGGQPASPTDLTGAAGIHGCYY